MLLALMSLPQGMIAHIQVVNVRNRNFIREGAENDFKHELLSLPGQTTCEQMPESSRDAGTPNPQQHQEQFSDE